MRLFVFRNATLEPFFPREETEFSGYGDISRVPENAEKICWFYTLPPDVSPKDGQPLVDDFLQKLRLVLPRVPADKRLELTRLAFSQNPSLVLADTRLRDAIHFYNAELEKIARERENALLREAPDFATDWRMWFLAQMPFSPAKKRAEKVPPRVPAVRKKCIVLDCDDTLWGGTLGEDGFSALKIGGDFPGNAFAFFQKKCVELAESGIILAICSKNNDADVCEVFEKHPAMILRREHISAWRVNWSDKAENIRQIADELNIGLDSLVFVDNEARERERVAAAFRGIVATPEFPRHAYELPAFFEKLVDEFFRCEKLTAEDLSKTQQYRDAAARSEAARNFSSLEDYIASLEIRLLVAPADDFSLPRLAQLTQKTNQFNLTTRRRTEAELRDFLACGNAVFSLSVADKIGDLGIVGESEISFSSDKKIARIENFMLSCRALGRGIETAFAQRILCILRERGVETVFAEYLPTAKNAPCKDFLSSLGFVSEENSLSSFRLNLRERDAIKINPIYQFVSDE